MEEESCEKGDSQRRPLCLHDKARLILLGEVIENSILRRTPGSPRKKKEGSTT